MMHELNRLGVTSLIDAGGGDENYPEHYQAIAKLAADKALTLRIGYTLMAQRPGREIEDYKGWLCASGALSGRRLFPPVRGRRIYRVGGRRCHQLREGPAAAAADHGREADRGASSSWPRMAGHSVCTPRSTSRHSGSSPWLKKVKSGGAGQ